MSVEQTLKRLMNMPPESLHISCMQDLTPEQQAIAQAGSWANTLQKKEAYRKSVAVLIAARQLYAVAYTELQSLLDKENQGPEALHPHPLTGDVFVQSAMHFASRPFSEHTLIESMVHVVMPWLADVVDTHAAFDQKANAQILAELEKERRLRGVPVGFLIDIDDDKPEIALDRPLTLVGSARAVYWVLREIVQFVVNQTESVFHVVHFVDGISKRGEANARLTRAGRSLWSGCADTNKKMPTVMAVLLDKMAAPPDLLVCDNLPEAYKRSYKGRPPGATAGDGNRGIFRWCKESGCALLGGVPLEDGEDMNITGPEYEQLRTFTQLRQVTTRKLDDGKVRIVVGNSQHFWDVEQSALDCAGPSNVLVPGSGV